MDPIGLSKIVPPELLRQPAAPSQHEESGSFAGMLQEAFQQMREIQIDADQQVRKLLAGERVDLHRVMLAGEKAGLASQLMMSVRNKVVDAYQEVMRMQV